MKFLVRAAVNGLALWIATLLLPGMALAGSVNNGVFAEFDEKWQIVIYFVIAGAILAVVNSIVRPLVKALSFPLYVLTLGLFFVVVNALMLLLTAWITSHLEMGLHFEHFGWALLAGLIVGVVNVVVDMLLPKKVRRKR